MAYRASTSLAAVLAAGALLTGSPAPDASSVIVVSGTAVQQEMAEWAVGRFTEAGLQLPAAKISFPGQDLSGCGGSPARAYLDREPVEVRMCWGSEMILLHELAHIWEAHAVPQDRHEPFMTMRDGVKSWAGLDDEWAERGREHAANVIAWGLLEDPYPISRTYPNDPDSLMEAFRVITGTDPLHDGGPRMPAIDRTLFEGRATPPVESGR